MKRLGALYLIPLIAFWFSQPLHAALGDERRVVFKATEGAFPLVASGGAASLVVDAGDWPGVRRAVGDLQEDIEAVSRVKPEVVSVVPKAGHVVIVGTIGRSGLLDELERAGKIDFSPVRGKWEVWMTQTIEAPFPGVAQALVIAGSDKRGTIYGVYQLSEQAGVSPWHWWADVAPHRHPELFVRAGRFVEDSPAVKYRGIFLNDEAPALSGWAKEKFGGLNSAFYGHVFELLLRLRANYLWPAMWNNAFNEDDAENPRLADEYGIVMGTSHHEPMLRSQREWGNHGKGPWDYAKNGEGLRTFWSDGVRRNRAFESVITMGMRGDGDEAMSEETNVALLERIVADQRAILQREVNADVTKVPQLWALYKEVQEYYEHGMRVPDDVILLWCDDNYGNIRRLPTAEERKRPGGAGVYYHFDYVGWPRSYKWLNTNSISKVWEQMHLARQYGADRLWIVNVGDLKPMEFPMEFFLTYAWNPERWPHERLNEFGTLWATREFGTGHAREIADLVATYTKYNAWIRPESLSEEPFSLVNYDEAGRVVAGWKELLARAERVNAQLPAERKDAFFQLVLYPIKACAIVNELYVAAGLSRLYAFQGRASANHLAARARELFKEDETLSAWFNEELGKGRWRHFADQTHIGYAIWQQPPRNAMPPVAEIQATSYGEIGVAIEGALPAWPEVIPGQKRPTLPPLDSLSRAKRWIEVFNRGLSSAGFTVETSQPWVRVSLRSGTVSSNEAARLEVDVDWAAAPEGEAEPTIRILGERGERVTVHVPVWKHAAAMAPAPGAFIEADGNVSIEAVHFSQARNDGDITWKTLAGYGRGLGGVTPFPVTAESRKLSEQSPRLEYNVHTSSQGEAQLELTVSPTLAFTPRRGLRVAVSIDDETPQVVDLKLPAGDGQAAWGRTVVEGARKIVTKHTIGRPGAHVIKVWMIDPAVVLQKVTLSFGTPRPSFFGPPESHRAGAQADRGADRAQPRGDANSKLAHEQLVQKARTGRVDTYFLGDSITRRWGGTDYPDFLAHWKKNFHGWNAGNFGWGGDTTRNVLWRIMNGELDGVNPKVIVLLAGTNDIGKDPKPGVAAQTVKGIEAILEVCKAKAPRATIVLMAILPRNDGERANAAINAVNEQIALLADGKAVRFLNINDQLADAQGKLFEGVTVDKLHLSLKGYDVWAQNLKPVLKELLGPPAEIDLAPPPTGDPSAKR
jgi:lysophospholipase L1-like esterase